MKKAPVMNNHTAIPVRFEFRQEQDTADQECGVTEQAQGKMYPAIVTDQDSQRFRIGSPGTTQMKPCAR